MVHKASSLGPGGTSGRGKQTSWCAGTIGGPVPGTAEHVTARWAAFIWGHRQSLFLALGCPRGHQWRPGRSQAELLLGACGTPGPAAPVCGPQLLHRALSGHQSPGQLRAPPPFSQGRCFKALPPTQPLPPLAPQTLSLGKSSWSLLLPLGLYPLHTPVVSLWPGQVHL